MQIWHLYCTFQEMSQKFLPSQNTYSKLLRLCKTVDGDLFEFDYRFNFTIYITLFQRTISPYIQPIICAGGIKPWSPPASTALAKNHLNFLLFFI